MTEAEARKQRRRYIKLKQRASARALVEHYAFRQARGKAIADARAQALAGVPPTLPKPAYSEEVGTTSSTEQKWPYRCRWCRRRYFLARSLRTHEEDCEAR